MGVVENACGRTYKLEPQRRFTTAEDWCDSLECPLWVESGYCREWAVKGQLFNRSGVALNMGILSRHFGNAQRPAKRDRYLKRNLQLSHLQSCLKRADRRVCRPLGNLGASRDRTLSSGRNRRMTLFDETNVGASSGGAGPRVRRLHVVRSAENYLGSGRPSTRLATMFRLISEVPPSIEFAFERNIERIAASSCCENSSPLQPRPF